VHLRNINQKYDRLSQFDLPEECCFLFYTLMHLVEWRFNQKKSHMRLWSHTITGKWFWLFTGITWIPGSDFSAGPFQRTKKCYITDLLPVWCCGDFISFSVTAYRSSPMWWPWRWRTDGLRHFFDKMKYKFSVFLFTHHVWGSSPCILNRWHVSSFILMKSVQVQLWQHFCHVFFSLPC
jgi:hypothetical protein